MSKVVDLHKKWIRDSDYRTAFDELKPEFDLARSLIEARLAAGLTQAQLAKRMRTTQSVVARLEGGRIHPSTRTLGKVAQATGTRLRISFESSRN
ncbi:MAG: helix-turn-helix transcriptional regulator [Nitrospira sp. SB0677_bin_15]|nr:helix-turn-helix transcriptional regulator [Nitrospira sp. SB0677_bin_15]